MPYTYLPFLPGIVSVSVHVPGFNRDSYSIVYTWPARRNKKDVHMLIMAIDDTGAVHVGLP